MHLFIEWKAAYATNIFDIDEQHKKLFSLINDLMDVASRNDNFDHYDEIIAIFDELSDYTIKHFAFEEQMLTRFNYSEMDKKIHELEHSAFIKKITQIRQQDLDKNEEDILQETIKFLAGWIEQHILSTDAKYVPFLAEQGAK